MDLLTDELIEPALSARDRDGVIEELVDLLVKANSVPSSAREKVVAAVCEREESQTTGLGSGVAIPHGLSDEVDEVVAALGVHREGVDFASVDAKPVHLVILLVVPPNRFQAHIRTLAGIARILNDPQLRRLIGDARQASEILDILVKREEAAV